MARAQPAWGLALVCALAAAAALPAALALGCPPGAGGSNCPGCSKGMYSPGGSFSNCKACPPSYTTLAVNSTALADCGELAPPAAWHAGTSADA